MSISGKAYLVYVRKRNETPLRSAMPATVRLALAPISVPLPPRQAPSDNAHHSGIKPSGPPNVGAIALIIGIIVATNGMLSTIADSAAEAHRMLTPVTVRSPPVASTSLLAKSLSRPA